MTLDKDNKPIDPKTGKKLKTKRPNLPAFIVAGIISLMLLVSGVLFASDKLTQFIADNFIVVSTVNLR